MCKLIPWCDSALECNYLLYSHVTLPSFLYSRIFRCGQFVSVGLVCLSWFQRTGKLDLTPCIVLQRHYSQYFCWVIWSELALMELLCCWLSWGWLDIALYSPYCHQGALLPILFIACLIWVKCWGSKTLCKGLCRWILLSTLVSCICESYSQLFCLMIRCPHFHSLFAVVPWLFTFKL